MVRNSRHVYVIARNVRGRPTLQHPLVDGTSSLTPCGQDMSEWSRSFQGEPIDSVLCRQPACRAIVAIKAPKTKGRLPRVR
jgi:hypothetical protein